MAVERINLRLDSTIQSEREILAAYEAISRSRRQEWLRSVIRAGMAAASNGQPIVVPQMAAPAISPATAAPTVTCQPHQATPMTSPGPLDAPLAVVASVPAQVVPPPSMEQAAAPSMAPTQSAPVEVKPKASKGSAALLKGFLPESGLLPESSAASALS